MESNILEPQTLDLKVLIEYDPVYETYVAHCLETGAVATANTPDEASAQIQRTLELDIRLADEQGGLEALFYTRAEPDIWDRWYQAKSAAKPEVVTLKFTDPPTPKRGVSSVTIATARKTA
jgi:predicted RNase H-like HicB family nuclease